MTEPKLIIRLEDSSVEIGGRLLLSNVSLEVLSGDRLYIFGTNGAGKSLTLDVLCGYVRQTSGRLLVGTEDVSGRVPSWRMRTLFGRTFQEPRVPEGLSVKEYLNLAIWGWPPGRRALTPGGWGNGKNGKIQRVVNALSMHPLLDRSCRALSVGERKLLGTAAAIVRGKRWLLLDEPYAGLSENRGEKISALIAEEQQAGVGVVIVEHGRSMWTVGGASALVLDGGRIVAKGEAMSILASEHRDRTRE